MFEDAQSFSFLGLTVYAYGACVALGAALWLGLSLVLAKRKNVPCHAVLLAGVLAVPLGLLFARTVFCLIELKYFLGAIDLPAAMLYFWDGGYSMLGALLGAALAALAAARITKIPFGRMADVLAVPAGLFIAAARLGEVYTVLGRGRVIDVDWMQNSRFFALEDAWSGDMLHAVFRYEAVAAIALVLVLLCLFFSRKIEASSKPGDLALVGIALFGAAQVVLESLRDDGHLMWGFVRASQVISILLPAAAIVVFSVRLIRREGMSWRPAVAWIGAAAAIGLAVIKEFDVDTSDNLSREYALMALAMAALAAVVLLLWRRIQKQRA